MIDERRAHCGIDPRVGKQAVVSALFEWTRDGVDRRIARSNVPRLISANGNSWRRVAPSPSHQLEDVYRKVALTQLVPSESLINVSGVVLDRV